MALFHGLSWWSNHLFTASLNWLGLAGRTLTPTDIQSSNQWFWQQSGKDDMSDFAEPDLVIPQYDIQFSKELWRELNAHLNHVGDGSRIREDRKLRVFYRRNVDSSITVSFESKQFISVHPETSENVNRVSRTEYRFSDYGNKVEKRSLWCHRQSGDTVSTWFLLREIDEVTVRSADLSLIYTSLLWETDNHPC